MRNRWVELIVGLFLIFCFFSLGVLALKVSGLTDMGSADHYILTADFDNIGSLKVKAPVSISGVKIGYVSAIKLNKNTFRAQVTLRIKDKYTDVPIDTSASILTQGLLGSNYISLMPGYEIKTLKPNQRIETTHSALILENLVGQLMFNLTGGKKKGITK